MHDPKGKVKKGRCICLENLKKVCEKVYFCVSQKFMMLAILAALYGLIIQNLHKQWVGVMGKDEFRCMLEITSYPMDNVD